MYGYNRLITYHVSLVLVSTRTMRKVSELFTVDNGLVKIGYVHLRISYSAYYMDRTSFHMKVWYG